MHAPQKTGRWVIAGIAALTLGSGAYAFADSLTVTSDPLSAGSALVPAGCSKTAHVGYELVFVNNPNGPNFTVTTVDITTDPPAVSGTPSPCARHLVQVTLTGNNAPGASGPFPVNLGSGVLDSNGSAHIQVLVPVPASDVTDVHVVIS